MKREYTVVLDGVVALPAKVTEKSFFDGLLDVVLAHVEHYQGQAAMSMKHKPYVVIETSKRNVNEVKHAKQNTQNGQRVSSSSQKIRQSRQRTRR